MRHESLKTLKEFPKYDTHVWRNFLITFGFCPDVQTDLSKNVIKEVTDCQKIFTHLDVRDNTFLF